MKENMHFEKCDLCRRQCVMDFYGNQLKSKTLIYNLSKLNHVRKYCDICKADINNFCRNKHMKNDAGFAYSLLFKDKTILSKRIDCLFFE